jgi:amino acid efflux transporter
MLTCFSVAMLAVYYFFDVNLQTALLIPSGAAILIYIIGSAAGIKLLNDPSHNRLLPWISLIASILVLPFVGLLAFASILTALAAFAYIKSKKSSGI